MPETQESFKRKYPRKAGRFLVQLYGKDFQIYTNVINIGAGGAFVNTLYLLNEGTFLNMKLKLPQQDKTLDIRGKVVRQVCKPELPLTTEHIGMAIEFTDVLPESTALIQEMVTTLN